MGEQAHCEFGCTGVDEAVHYGWYRCTPESRALLAVERAKLVAIECNCSCHTGGGAHVAPCRCERLT